MQREEWGNGTHFLRLLKIKNPGDEVVSMRLGFTGTSRGMTTAQKRAVADLLRELAPTDV
jgi:hypothetical protein